MSYDELFAKVKQVLIRHFENKIKQELHKCIVQFARIRGHSSSFKNVKNLTSNFRQIVQICCREKYQYKNNENFKAFCIILKHQQSTSSIIYQQPIVFLNKKHKCQSFSYNIGKMTRSSQKMLFFPSFFFCFQRSFNYLA